MMKAKEWGIFGLLGLIWGSSFLWIKIAVAEVGPFMLVSFRLLFGLVGLLAIMLLSKRGFARDRGTWLKFLFMAVINTAIPFTLISWGETKIDSALASILNGTVPLFTIVIAHFWLHDEKISFGRMVGLIIGFIGVVVLVSRDLNPEGLHGDLIGQLAVLLAAIFYATAITFSRKHLRGQNPLIQAASTLLIADSVMWLITPAVEKPMVLPTLPITWLAIAWLGLLGTCTAYLLFFSLINAWGATRASLVTYVFPVVGLILGIIFLNEQADWRLLVGSALVIVSVLAVNFNQLFRSAPAIAPTPTPVPASK
jgi:drug/metabolite transporter (DMT)-like permease